MICLRTYHETFGDDQRYPGMIKDILEGRKRLRYDEFKYNIIDCDQRYSKLMKDTILTNKNIKNNLRCRRTSLD